MAVRNRDRVADAAKTTSLLARAAHRRPQCELVHAQQGSEEGMGNAATPRALTARETSVTVPAGSVTLEGTLAIPDSADGVILFAHGSGSSRHSPRNRYVAEELRFAGFGTLLLDLLTPAEEAIDDETRELRFDIGFLADRLLAAMRWLSVENATRALPLGLFGASTWCGRGARCGSARTRACQRCSITRWSPGSRWRRAA
jgi:hypothetical protein